MNNNSKNILIALGIFVLAGALVTLGFFWGGVNKFNTAYGPGMMWQAEDGEGFVGAYGPGMMGGYANEDFSNGYGHGMMGGFTSEDGFTGAYGPGMMGGYAGEGSSNGYGHGMMGGFASEDGFTGAYGPGMMGGYANEDFSNGYGHGMMGGFTSEDGFTNGYGPGMMGGFAGEGFTSGYGPGMMGGRGGRSAGMMGGYGWQTGEIADPLSIEDNEAILEGFLAENGWSDQLEISDIMVFDNHAYAQLVEIESGIGAYEVLIDAATGTVYPEHGANMVWNLKYGMHGTGDDVTTEMDVTAAEAIAFAQEYLDEYLAGTTADDHAVPFYGYYTLHVLQDGEIVGMLSVQGSAGDVLLHTWHGDLVEMHDDLHE